MAPKRILHVVGGMDRGGVETWLMHVMRHIDRKSFQMDFLVHTTKPCAYDEEIRAMGGKVLPCVTTSRPWIYAPNFKNILRRQGPYDVVHSHVHHFSGFVLRLAQQAGVPLRLAHSHNDTSLVQSRAGFVRKLYLSLMRSWIDRYATLTLACSRSAGAALFRVNGRVRILPYGIDFTPFTLNPDPAVVRAELGIPPGVLVIGNVASFTEQKNHPFLVEIASEIFKRQPESRLLLVGDGPLRQNIEEKVTEAGLAGQVIFAGVRPDVPRLMLGAMDAFLMPSWFEGLPVVLIEAQAAGLPCIISDVITEEIDMLKPLIKRVSLRQPASAWAESLLSFRQPPPVSQKEALGLMERTSFNILNNISELEGIYGNL